MENLINFLDSGTVLIPVLIMVTFFLLWEVLYLWTCLRSVKKDLKDANFKLDRLFEEQRGYKKALRFFYLNPADN